MMPNLVDGSDEDTLGSQCYLHGHVGTSGAFLNIHLMPKFLVG
jgi:hypothetical protein